MRDTSQSNCLAPPEPMFRGGRLGGIQGAVIPQRFPTFEASESSASGFRNKRSKSSSVLNAVANSPKWIKLDGIHQRYVKRPEDPTRKGPFQKAVEEYQTYQKTVPEEPTKLVGGSFKNTRNIDVCLFVLFSLYLCVKFVCQSIYITYLAVYLTILSIFSMRFPSAYLPIFLSICLFLSIRLSIYSFIYPLYYVSFYLPTYLIYLLVDLSIC